MTDPETLMFKALVDPGRRAMLDALLAEDRTVTDLTRLLGVSQPAVSQHLNVLKAAGLVAHRKVGRHHYYSLRTEELAVIDGWLAKYRDFWAEKLSALEEQLAKRKN